jgi:glycosyltransferase involved in cell wall biosynthesis
MMTDREGHRYSTSELAPATVVEAAARGTPAIVSNLPGVDEQVRDGVTGVVIDPEQMPAELARIAPIFDDERRWSEFSAAARQFALMDRSPAAFGAKMVGFLDDVRRGRV